MCVTRDRSLIRIKLMYERTPPGGGIFTDIDPAELWAESDMT
jgi:hypothetical protein